ncbi:MAG: alpha/beta fold hydrolase [bacterium]
MKRFHIFWIMTTLSIAMFLTLCSKKKTDDRETIFDRVVHLETELHIDIPDVFRRCDRLDLQKHRIDVGDCELYVEEEGKGTPLLLINGGPGGTHHYFHPWFSRAKEYARVIYYDQRGCGLSDYNPGPDGYSVQQAVADLDAIRKALNVDKWVVLGYSYGGFLAQYYTINHPENMAGLVLMGASPGMWIEMNPSRQQEFITDEERAKKREIRDQLRKLAEENHWSPEKFMELLVYNNHLNGDWKRQNLYRPTRDQIAQMALYEWRHDTNFNGIMSGSMQRVDLTGAFEKCPIPTLILEGRWDLTWNTDKPKILHDNHPGAKLVYFEKASHGIYEEEPDQFFKVLKKFIKSLPEVAPAKMEEYKISLADWDRKKKASPEYILRTSGWGRRSNEKLAEAYTQEWFEVFKKPVDFLKIGFALYDVKRYEEALLVFQKMEEIAKQAEHKEYEALSLIWQGHMLDLMGKREEAIAQYGQAADMNISDTWSHGQYRMQYEVSAYAKKRMEESFTRIENQDMD